MINPFDYLFYKVYSGLSFISGGTDPYTQSAATCFLLWINLMTIWLHIFGAIPGIFPSIIIGLLGIVAINYYNKNEEKIIHRYLQESSRSRIIGNIVVLIYIVLTFVALIWTGKYLQVNR